MQVISQNPCPKVSFTCPPQYQWGYLKRKGRVGGSAPVLTTDSCTLPAPPSSPLANIFPELDRRRAYHLVHIKEGNAAFSIHRAHFKYPVMPFGVTNALGISQLENDILCDLLFEVMYLDDI